MENEERPGLLIDTSIWLEYLRNQERAVAVERMLQQVPLVQMALTEYAIGSIGHLLTSADQTDMFSQFVDDLLTEEDGTGLSLLRRS